MSDRPVFPDLVAVVTGASSGIGEATAHRLAREPGAQLVLVARREERLQALAQALPCPATYVACDVTDDDAPARIRAHVEAHHHGRLTLLVNNAGASWRGTFAEGGYRLSALRAFDLFPMTHHVECVALLEKRRL